MTVPTNNEDLPSTAFVEEMYVQGCKNEKGIHHSLPIDSRPEFRRWLAARRLPVSGDNAERLSARERYLAQPLNFGTDSHFLRMATADAFDAGWDAGQPTVQERSEMGVDDQQLWDVDAWDPAGKGLITARARVGVSSRNRIVAEIRRLTILELQHPGSCENCGHQSDCALHNGPALPVEPCDCKANFAASQPREVEVTDESDNERVARLMACVTPFGYASALALIEAETKMLEQANIARAASQPVQVEVTEARELPEGSVFIGCYYPPTFDIVPKERKLASVQLTRGRSIIYGERMEYPLNQPWERIEVLWTPSTPNQQGAEQ